MSKERHADTVASFKVFLFDYLFIYLFLITLILQIYTLNVFPQELKMFENCKLSKF